MDLSCVSNNTPSTCQAVGREKPAQPQRAQREQPSPNADARLLLRHRQAMAGEDFCWGRISGEEILRSLVMLFL